MLTRDAFVEMSAAFARHVGGFTPNASVLAVALMSGVAGCGQKGPLLQATPLPPASAASSAQPAR